MLPQKGAVGAPPALPIGALLAGAFALVVGTAWLAFRADLLLGPVNSAGMVALVHVFTLGFVGLVFAGTLQQLPAVMFVTRLAWPLLGWLTLPLLVCGGAVLVYSFATGFAPAGLAAGAVAVCLGWLLLLAQLLATALRRWPRDAGSHALITAVVFLTLTVIAGFLLASVRTSPALAAAVGYPVRLHLTLGMFGAFLLGIVGAGHKLLAMFALSKGGGQWRVRLAIVFVPAAVATEMLDAFGGIRSWPGIATILLATAALMQLLEVHAILRHRLRRELDAPVRRFVLAHAFLPLAGVLVLFSQPVAAAAVFLVGFVGVAVSGMLIKIASFLAWTKVFAGSGGVSRGAPLLRDLVNDRLEAVTTWALAAGALGLGATLVARSPSLAQFSAILLLIGALSLFVQVTGVVVTTERAGRRLARQAIAESAAATQSATPAGPTSMAAASPGPAPTAAESS